MATDQLEDSQGINYLPSKESTRPQLHTSQPKVKARNRERLRRQTTGRKLRTDQRWRATQQPRFRTWGVETLPASLDGTQRAGRKATATGKDYNRPVLRTRSHFSRDNNSRGMEHGMASRRKQASWSAIMSCLGRYRARGLAPFPITPSISHHSFPFPPLLLSPC